MSLEPTFGEPKTCVNWERDTGSKRRLGKIFGEYPVMFLGDVEIHWIHDDKPNLVLNKFKERVKLSADRDHIFLWYEAAMYNIHTEEERNSLVNRFNSIPSKTIFLTKYPHEEQRTKDIIVKFIPQWEGKSQYDRQEHFSIIWDDEDLIRSLFKKGIEDFYNENI